MEAGELDELAAVHTWHLSDVAEFVDGVWITSDSDVSVDFPKDAHRSLAELEDNSLWFTTRNRFIWDAIQAVGTPSALWDVGSGNGIVSRALCERGIEVISVEPSLSGASCAASRGCVSVCGTLRSLRLPAQSIESVGMFDVVEHLERPEDLLGEVRRVLRPGGLLAATVPAGQWLWSQADEVSGHHRRYSLRTLDALLESVGFAPLRRSYCFLGAVPLIWLMRTRPCQRGVRLETREICKRFDEELRRKSAPVELLGRIMMAVERPLVRQGVLPLGSSIVGCYRVTG